MISNLCIITWNANGLLRRQQELELFLYDQKIDVVFISESHFTSKTCMKIRGYVLHSCHHPSDRGRGGVVILLRDYIHHHLSVTMQQEAYQILGVTVSLASHSITLASVYCLPLFQLKSTDFQTIFNQLPSRL